jgi:hypothetical protein
MINALAPSATVAVGASWGRSQEWLLCARVLWDWLHQARPDRAPQGNVGVARQKRAPLQGFRLYSHLEQFVGMGGYGRLYVH